MVSPRFSFSSVKSRSIRMTPGLNVITTPVTPVTMSPGRESRDGAAFLLPRVIYSDLLPRGPFPIRAALKRAGLPVQKSELGGRYRFRFRLTRVLAEQRAYHRAHHHHEPDAVHVSECTSRYPHAAILTMNRLRPLALRDGPVYAVIS